MNTWIVTPDAENNAETWWDACREKFPQIAARLECGSTEVTETELEELQALPGFADGPDYAPKALLCDKSS